MKVRFLQCVAIVTLATACSGQTISTFAGTNGGCSTNDGVQATTACIQPSGIAMDQQGNLYFSDSRYYKIRKINPQGIVTTLGGTTFGYSGDGGPATSAQFALAGGSPALAGMAVDASGNIYISDTGNNVVRMIAAATGIVTTVAGNGTRGFGGDGGPANKASLNTPRGIAVDSAGNLYIADQSNYLVRKVSGGIISTFAGNGDASYEGDGVQANTTGVVSPYGLTFDNAGNLYISESDRIRKVDTSGTITTLAGAKTTPQTPGFSGDGGPATAALLNGPLGMAVDASGNLYFADANNQRVRKIDTGGYINTYAGMPGTVSSPLGDGGPATSAYLGMTRDVVLNAAGNLFIAAGSLIRKVGPGLGLAASPGSVQFSFSVGGAAPGSQTVNVTSTGSALSFTAAVTSGGSWLSVNPGSGTTPSTLTVSVNAAGLAGGTYQGTITLTPSGGGASPLAVSVTLTVSAAGAPVITSGAIVNATGYQATLAPDTVFVIFGSGLGPAALAAAAPPNYPTSLGGTSITFTPQSGGAPITAKMVYTSAGQVAGLIPSSISPGTYAVRLTYNNQTSAPQNVTVAARSFGIATANSAGTGAAQATIGNVNNGISLVRLTGGSISFGGFNWTLAPARPGDTLVLWGTGGGADPLNDAGGTSGDQTAAGNFSVIVDGTSITPLFAGASSGYPGLWQINFTLPSNIAADCFASVQVSAGGQLSNNATIAIAPAGQTSCSSTISPATLSKLDSGTGTITMAGLNIGQVFTGPGAPVQSSVGGVINRYTASEFLIPYTGPRFGACMVLDQTYNAGDKEPSAADATLDAGSMTLTGPNSVSLAVGKIASPLGPVYTSPVSIVNGGTYTLSATGGTQVGPFSIPVTFPTSFTVTNFNALANVNRSQPLTINWTGSGFNQVVVDITTQSQSAIVHSVTVTCQVPASLGTYTIPVAALQRLIPGATTSQLQVIASNSKGGITSAESTTDANTVIPLVGGGLVDFGGFGAYIDFLAQPTVQ